MFLPTQILFYYQFQKNNEFNTILENSVISSRSGSSGRHISMDDAPRWRSNALRKLTSPRSASKQKMRV